MSFRDSLPLGVHLPASLLLWFLSGCLGFRSKAMFLLANPTLRPSDGRAQGWYKAHHPGQHPLPRVFVLRLPRAEALSAPSSFISQLLSQVSDLLCHLPTTALLIVPYWQPFPWDFVYIHTHKLHTYTLYIYNCNLYILHMHISSNSALVSASQRILLTHALSIFYSKELC